MAVTPTTVLEVGAGPFTQLKFVLQSKPAATVNSVTIIEPLLHIEGRHPNSAYRSGMFTDGSGREYPTTLIKAGGEEMAGMFYDKFDTVIMQNVLEHVHNAYEVLEVLHNATKPGGTIIFWGE